MDHILEQLQKIPFLQKATDSVAGFLFSLLLSVGLLGGSSYVLFQATQDIHAVEQALLGLERQQAEFALEQQMAGVWQSSWLADRSNLQAVTTLIADLEHKNSAEPLDAAFVQETTEWLSDAVLELTSEKGQIAGFVFQQDYFRSIQARLLDLYDPYIVMLKNVSRMISTWEQGSPADRTEQFESLHDLYLEFFTRYTSLDTYFHQRETDREILLNEIDLAHRKAEEDLNIVMTKTVLSTAGVFLGILFLGIVLVLNAYRHL